MIGGAIVGTPSSSPPSNPLLGAVRADQWGAGGTYAFGPVTLGLLYTGSLYTNSSNAFAAPSGTIHFHNYEGSIRYQLTPALILALGEDYTSVRQSGVSGHYLQTSAGADYFLSKRTDVYLNALYQKSSKNLHANFDAASGAASGTSPTAIVVGIRHKFQDQGEVTAAADRASEIEKSEARFLNVRSYTLGKRRLIAERPLHGSECEGITD